LKKFIAVVAAFVMVAVGATPANASEQWSPWDVFTPFWSYDEFDVDRVGFRVSSIPGRLDFFVEVAAPYYSFSYTLGDYVGISIDANLDGNTDYLMSIDEQYFDGNRGVPTTVFDVRNNRLMPECDAEFWGASTYVIGFDLKASCLNLPSTFGIMGFAYTALFDEMDLVPDVNHFRVNYSGGGAAVGPTKTVSDPPSATSMTRYRVAKAGSAPDDLVALSSTVGRSVVTLYCGNSQGTGWSAKVNLSRAMQSAGIRSYIITNHHVVEECLSGQRVEIVTSSGVRHTGEVVGFDRDKDVAAITTTASIAGLEWVGERPAVGWWAGVMGSPFNNQGTLSTGIVSSVVGSEVVTSAPLNPGNSGGPVFDRSGRVIGIATAIRTNANLIGFAGSTDYLCGLLVTCPSPGVAWLNPTTLSEAPATPDGSAPASSEFRAWTKAIQGREMKFYARGVIGAGKITFVHNGREVSWVRATRGSDSKINLAGDGMVRTIELRPGRNVLEIYQDGKRVVRRIANG